MASGDRRLYVYALAEPGLPLRMRIRRRQLRTLTVGRISVVVEFRTDRPLADADTLQEQHELLMGLAARSRALLPARFGSLLTAAHLRATVQEHEALLAATLARVRGCWQMTIRVFGTPDRPVSPVNRSAGGAAYLRSRRAEMRHRPAEVEAIHRALAPLVADERIEAGRQASLRATVFHLVSERALEAYRDRAADLQTVLAPSRLTVTGPWPPFAFSPELF